MKLSYTKQLRPMVVGPMLPGFGQERYPLYGAYTWFDEKDVTKDTEKQWEEEVKKQDPLATMAIQIRYV